jgi:hypothetical protein
MILPSKSISEDQALLTIGAQILDQLDAPATVNALWNRVTSLREDRNAPSLPFWWFALALDLLYSLGAVHFADGQLVRSHAS